MTLRLLHAAAMGTISAGLIGAVVACAPSSDAAPGNPPGPNDPFATCMTDNGVPAPPQGGPGAPGGQPSGPPPQGGPGGQPNPGAAGGPPPAPPGVDQSVWDKGLQACASLAPAPPQQR
ncbi:hypothetical protein [Mycolicibacterium aichiense]|uniref:Lipoprotein n=1 Tax=Mycolicibacterium aichiense TaxID=1799 RepID=A0AAD1MAS5_9MYCO|nr:hypothetical protein [Mycolicibacterium aichiense]MCV7021329.1 hypothetical protein [Mycolicibacterium aichiense]BBX05911.1 hypothetical protein MAIC_07140 [Mycolicibacterium aichiense]STZ24748.1 Uncharacterised protein [Mycolicibacterium aichiense]